MAQSYLPQGRTQVLDYSFDNLCGQRISAGWTAHVLTQFVQIRLPDPCFMWHSLGPFTEWET